MLLAEAAESDAAGVGIVLERVGAADLPKEGGCGGCCIDACCSGGGSESFPPADTLLQKPEVFMLEPRPMLSKPAKGSDGANCGWGGGVAAQKPPEDGTG